SSQQVDSPSSRARLNQEASNTLAGGISKDQHNRLLSKLSRSEHGREGSPIPVPRPEFNSEIHKPAMNTKQSSTGVLWVTERAGEYGFEGNGDKDWANLGQGAPEHGDTVPGSF
ncbi:hypothetical protein OXX79_013928, partial [Metschnikowia pulcherrima]